MAAERPNVAAVERTRPVSPTAWDSSWAGPLDGIAAGFVRCFAAE
jgi:hypothetical protein